MIRSIISQQISNKAFASVYAKFLNIVGSVDSYSILSKTDEEIQKAGISFKKVEYIKNVCIEEISGSIDFENLRNLSDDEIIKTLSQIKGVGVWTAEMTLIFSLNRKDVLSYNDLIIRKNLMKLFKLETLNKKEFLAYKSKFSPYGSILSFYLWEMEKL